MGRYLEFRHMDTVIQTRTIKSLRLQRYLKWGGVVSDLTHASAPSLK